MYTKYKPQLIFFAVFTFAFIIIKQLFLYFLPFIIGIAVSFVMYPVYSFMKKRLSFKPAFSATVITLFIFSIVIALIVYLLYLLITETMSLYSNNREIFDEFLSTIDFSETLKGLNISGDMFSKISDTAFSIVRIVPISIALIVISFVSTVCFINNLSFIKQSISSKLPDKYNNNFEHIVSNSRHIVKKFIRSYLILYSLTFIEALFVFKMINLDYVVVFAFLTAVSDLLPILGPGTVYLPIAVVKFISGDYLSALTLLIFWAVTIVIRQIIEPKLISDTIKIHPLVILSGLYFSIVSSNIWVLFYVIIFAVLYKILVESKVLVPIFYSRDTCDNKEC